MKFEIHEYIGNKFLKVKMDEKKVLYFPMNPKHLIQTRTWATPKDFQIVITNDNLQGDGFLRFILHLNKKGYAVEFCYSDSFNYFDEFTWRLRKNG